MAVFEQASKLLVPSIEGHDLQKKKDAGAARAGIQSYLVHIREEYRIIDHELSQQDQLAEEKDCVINCLAVCRQALDDSNCPMLKDFIAEEDTAQVITWQAWSLEAGTITTTQTIGISPSCQRQKNFFHETDLFFAPPISSTTLNLALCGLRYMLIINSVFFGMLESPPNHTHCPKMLLCMRL